MKKQSPILGLVERGFHEINLMSQFLNLSIDLFEPCDFIRQLLLKSFSVALLFLPQLPSVLTAKFCFQVSRHDTVALRRRALFVKRLNLFQPSLLAHLNGNSLNDPRVEVIAQDVWAVIVESEPVQYSAVVIDIDNGPSAMVQKQNQRLYSLKGLQRIASVLKPDGRALFWSARTDPAFAERLVRAGFKTKVISAPLYTNAKRCAVSIYVADR